MYYISEGQAIRNIKGHGSVLGPLPRNIKYDAVPIVVVVKYLDDFAHAANKAVKTIRQQLSSVGFQLPDHKTETLLATSRKIRGTTNLPVED